MKLRKFARRGGDGWKTQYVPGSYNAMDDVTGLQHKAHELSRQWDGLMTADPEERHPQDYLRSVPDRIRVPWSRPDSNTFLD